MCTHYRAPNEPEELNQLRLPLLGPLYEREPWKQEIYPDYLAPIVRAAGDGAEAVLAAVLCGRRVARLEGAGRSGIDRHGDADRERRRT